MEPTERANEAPHNSYNDISKVKKPSYGKNRSNSDPTYDRHPPMIYITLVPQSPSIASNKNVDGGALFQCQELDGGNAIECEFIYFQS